MAKEKKITVDFYEKKGKPYCTIIYNRKNTKFNYSKVNRNVESLEDIDIENDTITIKGLIKYITENINPYYDLVSFHSLLEFLLMPMQYGGTSFFIDLGDVLTYNEFKIMGRNKSLLQMINYIKENYNKDILTKLKKRSINEFIQHIYLLEFSLIENTRRVDWILDEAIVKRYFIFMESKSLKDLMNTHNFMIDPKSYYGPDKQIEILKSALENKVKEFIVHMAE